MAVMKLVKPLVKVLMYSGFLFSALLITFKSIEDYMKGNTSFLVNHTPITQEDLPSLIACFRSSREQELTYGKHHAWTFPKIKSWFKIPQKCNRHD